MLPEILEDLKIKNLNEKILTNYNTYIVKSLLNKNKDNTTVLKGLKLFFQQENFNLNQFANNYFDELNKEKIQSNQIEASNDRKFTYSLIIQSFNDEQREKFKNDFKQQIQYFNLNSNFINKIEEKRNLNIETNNNQVKQLSRKEII